MPTPQPKDAPRPIAEIEQGPSKFEQFLDRNQRNLIILGVILVVGMLSFVAIRTIREDQRHDAGAALVKADDLTALQDVIKNHAGSPAAGSAHLLAADAQWQDGRQDDSIATLQAFLSDFPSHSAKPAAIARLGSRLMAQGKNGDAKTQFQSLIDLSDGRYLAPYALVSLGDIARSEDDLEAAEGYYARARDEYPDNNFSSVASQHLLLLRAVPPTEIDPPPVAEEDPAAAGRKPAELTPPPALVRPAGEPEPIDSSDPNQPKNPLLDMLTEPAETDDAPAPEPATEAPAETPAPQPTPADNPDSPTATEPTPAGKPAAAPADEPEMPAETPTEEPAAEPTEEPAAEPAEEPAAEPAGEPAAEPAEEPESPPTDASME